MKRLTEERVMFITSPVQTLITTNTNQVGTSGLQIKPMPFMFYSLD